MDVGVRLAPAHRTQEVGEVARLDTLDRGAGDVSRFDRAGDRGSGTCGARRLCRAAAEPRADPAALVAGADVDVGLDDVGALQVAVRQPEADLRRTVDF